MCRRIQAFPQGQRVYSEKGIASTIAGNAGGLGGKTGLYAVNIQKSGRGKGKIETRVKKGFGVVGTSQGGNTRQEMTLAIPVLTPDRKKKRQHNRH